MQIQMVTCFPSLTRINSEDPLLTTAEILFWKSLWLKDLLNKFIFNLAVFIKTADLSDHPYALGFPQCKSRLARIFTKSLFCLQFFSGRSLIALVQLLLVSISKVRK